MFSSSKQIGMYDWAGNSVAAWVGSADSLLAAARVLRADRDASGVAPLSVGDAVPDTGHTQPSELMLKGYALECLLKALWVKRGNKLALNGILQRVKGAAAHDLVQLSQKVGLAISPAEQDVLKRLSLFTTSVGRYPIPTHWTQTKIQKAFGGGSGPPTCWQTPSDDKVYDSIVKRMEAEIDQQ